MCIVYNSKKSTKFTTDKLRLNEHENVVYGMHSPANSRSVNVNEASATEEKTGNCKAKNLF